MNNKGKLSEQSLKSGEEARGERPQPNRHAQGGVLAGVETTISATVAADSAIRAYRDLRCRVCGCTHFEPCEPPCAWVRSGREDLCTGCRDAAAAVAEWLEGAHRPNKAALWREVERLAGGVGA